MNTLFIKKGNIERVIGAEDKMDFKWLKIQLTIKSSQLYFFSELSKIQQYQIT
jgi:hypothetical protein